MKIALRALDVNDVAIEVLSAGGEPCDVERLVRVLIPEMRNEDQFLREDDVPGDGFE